MKAKIAIEIIEGYADYFVGVPDHPSLNIRFPRNGYTAAKQRAEEYAAQVTALFYMRGASDVLVKRHYSDNS